jgi:tRNA(His) guanylyltransferase
MHSIDFDNLGSRAKQFESVGTMDKLVSNCPILARMDGRAFHSFARHLKKPYDPGMSRSMIETTKYLVDNFNADLGYTQSDEITLYWKNNTPEVQLMFSGRTHKWVSSLASSATIKFYKNVLLNLPAKSGDDPTFDARVWQVPTENDALEVFMWREMDATKNAVSMAASSFYRESILNGKTMKERIQMLHEAGIDFNKYPDFFKRGTFVRKMKVETLLTNEEWESIPDRHRPESQVVLRNRVVELNLPSMRSFKNLEEVSKKFFD